MGAVLQQRIGDTWCPLAYFSRKLTPAQTKYSTFDRELLAIYLAIKHFQHYIEGRDLYVCSDHKPLTFALSTRLDKHSPRQARYLDFISQFTSDIRHLQGHNNALEHTSHPAWNFHTLATAQREEDSATAAASTSLDLQRILLPTTDVTLLCDMPTGTPCPYVPPNLRHPIFDHFHGLSHLGVRATQRSSPHNMYGLGSTWTFASGHVPASHVNSLKSRPISSPPQELSFPRTLGLNMSMWTWLDLYPHLKATPTCLHVWTASPGGLRPFPSPTSPRKQSHKPSCLGGFPVLEYPPPLHLTVTANSSLACGLNSWLSWVSTVQGQLLTTPALMDWWKIPSPT